MRAAIYEQFQGEISVRTVPDPEPPAGGVVLSVRATGVCLSDWHGWMGHDPDIHPPHVPGHELAGVVEAVGDGVTRWRRGDRVTMPFVCGCGECPQCESGNHQVCDHQFQPGFTGWGSFAQFVAIRYADINLVRLPEEIDTATAASLGCRFVTSFRAVVDQARVQPEQWVAVHGCGGVGLSAVMIASAVGARVLAVDIFDEKLDLARDVGAVEVINARTAPEVVEAIRDVTEGGAHASLDALGNPTTSFNSISCLRKRGRHIQVGLMVAEHSRPPVPMDQIVANELELYGSHGIQAPRYSELLQMIEKRHLHRRIGNSGTACGGGSVRALL
jgi:alcohol dehydrogenase